MRSQYILSIDQGTTSSRVVLIDEHGRLAGSGQCELSQSFPRPGWVEQCPLEILRSVKSALSDAMAAAGITPSRIAGIGIANQRETTVVWDRMTGRPIYNAIVWQSRQSASICEDLKAHEEFVRERTGLVIDPYFCGSKIKWILDNVENARTRAVRGELLFGTIDSWLVWKLTGGKAHISDVTNASRTLLFDIHSRRWDEGLLELFGVPACMLPRVTASSGPIGSTSATDFLPAGIPISGIAGDQQAAMFGHACFEPGMAKATYGTGCFVLMNTGAKPIPSAHGMLTTIAWDVGGKVDYAIEGSVFVAGAVVQWLRDGLQIIDSAADTCSLAESIESSDGVYMVPAFVGMGAPYWNREARGTILGLTRGSRREHLVRAALESIAFQATDVIHAMQSDAGMPVAELRVDGGAIANDFLAQFQSDVLGVAVCRPRIVETTALGAAYLSGLGCGLWNCMDDVASRWECERRFQPRIGESERSGLRAGWQHALRAAMEFRADATLLS